MPYLADAVPGWFQAVLTLYDARGRELAYDDDFRFNPDPVLHYDVPADGEYVLEIKDAIYRGREDFVYRITMGELPYVTSVFPLGGRAGASHAIEVAGWNLPTQKLVFDAKKQEPGSYVLSVPGAKFASNRFPFVVDALPEVFEKEGNNSPKDAQSLKVAGDRQRPHRPARRRRRVQVRWPRRRHTRRRSDGAEAGFALRFSDRADQ